MLDITVEFCTSIKFWSKELCLHYLLLRLQMLPLREALEKLWTITAHLNHPQRRKWELWTSCIVMHFTFSEQRPVSSGLSQRKGWVCSVVCRKEDLPGGAWKGANEETASLTARQGRGLKQMREREKGSHQKRSGESHWASRAHTTSSQLLSSMGEVKAHGQKLERSKDGEQWGSWRQVTCGAGEAWTVKLIHSEKVEPSDSNYQSEGRQGSG